MSLKHSTDFAFANWSSALPNQKEVSSGSVMFCEERDTVTWTTNRIVFCMGSLLCIAEVGIQASKRTIVETISATCYPNNGRPRFMLINWVMRLGRGAEVRNVTSVPPNASGDVVCWVPARICRLYLQTILVLPTLLISMLSMSLNTMLRRCALYISHEKGRPLSYGFSRRTGP